jgi:AcrR family transcriptional regulator
MALSRRTEAQSAKRVAIEAAVLRATEELLAGGSSFADLKIEQIATRAGISRTAFYFYFSDKRELLMRLAEDVAELLYAEAERWWSTGEAAELREAMDSVLSLYAEHHPLLGAVVEAATYDQEVAAFWRALLSRFADATQARIETEQAAGRARRDISARAAAFALCWMVERSCYQVHHQRMQFAPGELRDAIVAIWQGAIAPTAPA